jgi:phosphosulfolactate synthase (CoM biosynthesis protein A)
VPTDSERAFSFLRLNGRPGKPARADHRNPRGPYDDTFGRRHLEDVFETVGAYVDTLKFAAARSRSCRAAPSPNLIELCHSHDVRVSTGGFLEYVLTQGPETVNRYLDEARELGFDIVEISSGFVAMPADDLVALTQRVLEQGLKPKPEVGIQFGAGGASTTEALEATELRVARACVTTERRGGSYSSNSAIFRCCEIARRSGSAFMKASRARAPNCERTSAARPAWREARTTAFARRMRRRSYARSACSG